MQTINIPLTSYKNTPIEHYIDTVTFKFNKCYDFTREIIYKICSDCNLAVYPTNTTTECMYKFQQYILSQTTPDNRPYVDDIMINYSIDWNDVVYEELRECL